MNCIEQTDDAADRRPGRTARRPDPRSRDAVDGRARPRDRTRRQQGARHDIPFLDLKAQYNSIKPEIDAAIQRSSRARSSCSATRSPAFEREFAAYCGAKHGIAVNPAPARCTWRCSPPASARRRGHHDAVHVRRHGLGDLLHRRDAGVRRHRSGDVHDGPGAARAARSRRAPRRSCRCISTARWPTWTRSWRSPNRHGIPVIEDACQAHGAEYKGKRAGSLGVSGCFSFYPGQEPRRLRRRRHGRHEQRRACEDDAHAARLGPGEALSPRAQGLQLPDGRHPGRHPAREAASPRAVDRGAPRARARSTTRCWRARRS